MPTPEGVERNRLKKALRALEASVAPDYQSSGDAAMIGRQLRDALNLRPGETIPADEP